MDGRREDGVRSPVEKHLTPEEIEVQRPPARGRET
jgi:hypothetical protein